MMKLLSKSEVDRAKALDTRREQEEGLKLARKVDALREVASKEEENLAKFRTASLKRTKEEIEDLIHVKNNLESDVKNLKEQKRLLQIPLDAESEKLKARNEELSKLEQEITKRLGDIEQVRIELNDKKEALLLESERIDDQKTEIRKMVSDAIEKTENATKAILEASKIDLISKWNCSERKKKIFELEHELAYKITDVSNREKRVTDRENDQNIREREINDKYATLQRTINRLKK